MNKKKLLFNNESGLTLIEVLATVTIIAILALAVTPLFGITQKRSQEIELKRSLRVIRKAIDNYKEAYDNKEIEQILSSSGYPENLMVLVEGVDNIKSIKSGTKIKFLRRIPRDPMNKDSSLDASETWGLRSYASDWDSPKEGDDVYDVYSLNEDEAMDGTYYKDW